MADSERLPLERLVEKTWPKFQTSQERLLLAVSGGADSVALLRAVLNIHPEPKLIEVGHFNHGWRGTESDQDASFVQSLCRQHQLPCHIGRASHSVEACPSSHRSPFSEQAARDQRYQFLESTAYAIGARYVLVAHTASDRVETLLHHLFRGTGIAGARSIEIARGLGEELVLLRPLLRCSRNQVLGYLETIGQDYREDPSNADLSYRRNFLRHRILPLIREVYGDSSDQRLLAFTDVATEIDQMLLELANEYWREVDQVVSRSDLPALSDRMANAIIFPSREQREVHWPILHRALSCRWLVRGWPLGKMRRLHWRRIRHLHEHLEVTVRRGDAGGNAQASQKMHICEEPHRSLPGNLQLLTYQGWIIIRKSDP